MAVVIGLGAYIHGVCYFQWMLISKVEEGNFIQHFHGTLAEPRVKSARLEPNLVFSVCMSYLYLQLVVSVCVCVRTYVRDKNGNRSRMRALPDVL